MSTFTLTDDISIIILLQQYLIILRTLILITDYLQLLKINNRICETIYISRCSILLPSWLTQFCTVGFFLNRVSYDGKNFVTWWHRVKEMSCFILFMPSLRENTRNTWVKKSDDHKGQSDGTNRRPIHSNVNFRLSNSGIEMLYWDAVLWKTTALPQNRGYSTWFCSLHHLLCRQQSLTLGWLRFFSIVSWKLMCE